MEFNNWYALWEKAAKKQGLKPNAPIPHLTLKKNKMDSKIDSSVLVVADQNVEDFHEAIQVSALRHDATSSVKNSLWRYSDYQGANKCGMTALMQFNDRPRITASVLLAAALNSPEARTADITSIHKFSCIKLANAVQKQLSYWPRINVNEISIPYADKTKHTKFESSENNPDEEVMNFLVDIAARAIKERGIVVCDVTNKFHRGKAQYFNRRIDELRRDRAIETGKWRVNPEKGKGFAGTPRDVVEKLVWSKPVTDIAKDYGVSDNAINKYCRKHDIVKPGRGYWAKMAVIKNEDQKRAFRKQAMEDSGIEAL